jgi:hypothetical protein
MNTYAKQVKEFNDAFNTADNKNMYAKFIREEFNEWMTEVEERNGSEHELKELCDLLYTVYGYAYKESWDIEKNNEEVGTIVGKVKEFTDKFPGVDIAVTIILTAYAEFLANKNYIWTHRFAQGIFAYAQAKELPLEQAFKRVHKSNMSKMEEGKVLRREDGKVLKGKNYKEAVLTDLLTPKVVKLKTAKK